MGATRKKNGKRVKQKKNDTKIAVRGSLAKKGEKQLLTRSHEQIQ